MKCVECEKVLVEKTIATKTKKVGGHVVVEASRQALVCAEHGVVAWDPVKPFNAPYVPYVPYTPWVQPWKPTPWGGLGTGTAKPFWSGTPTNICNGAGNNMDTTTYRFMVTT